MRSGSSISSKYKFRNFMIFLLIVDGTHIYRNIDNIEISIIKHFREKEII